RRRSPHPGPAAPTSAPGSAPADRAADRALATGTTPVPAPGTALPPGTTPVAGTALPPGTALAPGSAAADPTGTTGTTATAANAAGADVPVLPRRPLAGVRDWPPWLALLVAGWLAGLPGLLIGTAVLALRWRRLLWRLRGEVWCGVLVVLAGI